MQNYEIKESAKLEDSLMFAGTIYESFEALEEVMGKLKLERPLFLIYLAKREFADAVFKAAGEKPEENSFLAKQPPTYVEIFNPNFQNLQ